MIPALVVAALLPGALTIARKRAALVDSRVETRQWLEANTQVGERILVTAELRFLPQELARLPARVRIVDTTAAVRLLRGGRFRYVVAGRTPPPGEDWPLLRALPLRRYSRKASFGTEPVPPMGWWWFGNLVGIDVFARPVTWPDGPPADRR
jgi:hypothetical protein